VVERHVANVNVVSSTLITRFLPHPRRMGFFHACFLSLHSAPPEYQMTPADGRTTLNQEKDMTHPALILSLIFTMALAAYAAEPQLPPTEQNAKEALNKSPRHGEWVDITVPNSKVPLKAFIVYPERKDKAPVVLVIQEIFGLTDWIRSVADQLAAEGFIAIAPDMLSGKGPNGGGTESSEKGQVTRMVSQLNKDEVMADLNAARDYGMKLPASNGKTACVGFCWGGGMSFLYATRQPDLSAAAVYYGTPPAEGEMAKINAAVMGFYGGNDNRVTSTVPVAEKGMKAAGKSYTPHVYEGAGHGFLRQQDGQNGANMKAAKEAWPATIEFFKEKTK
jgi:carboxymethylenebutenolidase